MPYLVTAEEVTDGFPSGSSAVEIAMILSMLSAADECMEAKSVPSDVGKLLKIYAARHLLTLGANGGGGMVTQRSSASGASQTLAGWQAGRGVKTTSFGAMLSQLDSYGCVSGLLAGDAGLFMGSIGPPNSRR